MKHTGIHILDFNDKIIDYISRDDGALLNAVMSNNAEEKSETFDFTMLNDRAEHLRERNRIIAQDNNGVYREFIISHVVDNFDGTTDVESNASYLEDIDKSRPIKPGKYSSYSTSQALNETLRNTGWEMSDDTEHGGMRTTSWTSYSTPYEVINMLCTTYGMVAEYYIELGSHTVEHRYVSLKKPTNLFKGKEITKGKDLTGMTRTVDMSEVRTALYAIGPENDTGQRLEKIVTDDDAQAQFGLPGRYLWSVYEPESDDSNMTDARLTTLAKTELNKRNKSAISYEITSTDIHKHYPEMVVSLHDTVRIKDRDFRPPLYIEAEVIGVDYNLLTDESNYKFGNVVEYEENNLRDIFNKKLANISKKLNDNVTNINTIVNDVVSGQLEYYERKIFKQDTPPDNPVNDMLWYDTSNPNVAVLRRYWNGEWLNETVDDVEKIGGITREKALFSELTNTFTNLSIQHAKLQSNVYEVVTSEYLVDDELKAAVDNAYNNTTTVFDNIKTNLDSMKPETATIGKLVDTQALFLKYRERMQTLYKAIENAKRAIDKRFKLLQSQYTDEKFNEAMQNVASSLPNGVWNEDTMQLTSDIPNQQHLEDLRTSLQAYTDGQISNLNSVLGKEIDSKINTTKNEISASISSVERKIDGIEVGGRNLIRNSEKITDYIILSNVEKAGTYSLGFEPHFTENIPSEFGVYYGGSIDILANDKPRITHTFEVSEDRIGKDIRLFFGGAYMTHKNFTNNGYISKVKLEYGNVATDWTPAPEDIEDRILNSKQEAEQAAKKYADAQDELQQVEAQAYADGVVDAEEQRAIQDATDKMNTAKTYAETKATEAQNAAIADAENKLKPITTRVTTTESNIKVLQDGLKLTATKTEVEQTLNDKLAPIQNQVNEQKSTLDVLPEQIASKVSQSEYTTDQNNIVSRLDSADSERVQLANQISDRVTLKQYNDMKIGTRNLLLNSKEQSVSTSTSLTHAFMRYYLSKPLEIGKEYALISEVYSTSEEQSGSISVRAYTPDNGLITVPIENNRIKVSFVAKVESTQLLLYKDVAGQSPHTLDTVFKNTMLVEGNKIGDYEQAPEETEQRLTTMQTSIEQNGTDINARATKEEFNASRKTLSKVVSDLTVNTTTGITLSYDENGVIQSSTVGPDGIKIRGDKVDIAVNKEFQVLAGNVDDKVGKNEVVNRLNLSPEGLDINVNKIGIRGGDATNYINIKNDNILSYGKFERSWAGTKDTANLELGISNGRIMVRNQTTGYRLYLTERGLSTMMDGFSDDTSGTLEFHSKRFNDTSRGITMHSTYGAVAMLSEQSRAIIRSNLTANIESYAYGVYIRPYFNTRPGVNEFNFYVKDNDNAGDTDGALLFGEVSDDRGLAGSGIRFKKKGIRGETSGDYEPMAYATDNQGNIGSGSFYGRKFYGDLQSRSGYLYLQADDRVRITDYKGYNNGNPNYVDLQCKWIQSESIRTTSTNFYIGTSTGEVKITNNLLYNGGDIGYKPIRASAFNQSSLEQYKKDIEEWNYDALNVISNELQLYQYKLKDESDAAEGLNHRGVIIGDSYETPTEFIHGDGVNLYEMVSWSLRAIQQLNGITEKQNEKIEQLEAKINGTK
ncbi:phage tail spike protein [Staphylococcus cohnii]|uniref:phage tail spike protein n=1 Tax=Staphylococcus cohnii TaxID=29382 RepID=UPI003879C3E7